MSECVCMCVCACIACMHTCVGGGAGREGLKDVRVIERKKHSTASIYACTHKNAHTHIGVEEDKHFKIYTHTLTIWEHTHIHLPFTHTLKYKYIYSCMHACIHSSRACTHTYTHHAHSHTHTLTTHTHTHIHSPRTHTHTHNTCTHAHMQAYQYTYTHKHVLLQTNIHIYGSKWLNGFVYMNRRISTYSHTPDSEKWPAKKIDM